MGKRYDITVEIMKELTDYTEDVQKGIEKAAARLAKEAAAKLKETSPRSRKDHKHYAEGWAVRKYKENGKLTIIIHNKLKPHLTHLLEYGHLDRSGARVKGKEHIEPVQGNLNRDFEKACEEIVRNGG